RFKTEANQPAGGIFGADIEVKPGEIFTLLGPSGCGKTTTLRCVAGLERPESGAISLDGEVVFDSARGCVVPMYDRDIAMVFQSYAIWPHMTVFENAAYPLRFSRAKRVGGAEVDKRVTAILEAVGLAGYRNRSATQLSGGQQQRLALARALVRRPKLLLLDEPLSNLDAQLREQMRGELKRIQAESGVTTLYVTHDQGEAMAMSNRLAVLNQGRIVQTGAPDEIYDTPNCEFVANFIGRTNLLRGEVEEAVAAGGCGAVKSQIGRIICRFAASAVAGETVSFVIRPENVEIQAPDASAINIVEGRVAARTYLGEAAEYTIDLDGRFNLLARAHPSLVLGQNERVRLRLPQERTIAVTSGGGADPDVR